MTPLHPPPPPSYPPPQPPTVLGSRTLISGGGGGDIWAAGFDGFNAKGSVLCVCGVKHHSPSLLGGTVVSRYIILLVLSYPSLHVG